MDSITYTGNELRGNSRVGNLDIYDPSPELVDAVNIALILEQPLLLMGEPGCGKTRLAESVAAELHGESYAEHFFRWDIKSTSKAKDGIYQYDALRRMYDANTGNSDAKEAANYISYGKFAEALTKRQNGNKPNILLIDEIDKADIDFPNDLLMEIEKGEFYIQELNKLLPKSSHVLIFITSNRERELPPAFLRRCLYHYIKFPTQRDLVRIVNMKFGNTENQQMIHNAVSLFIDLRAKIEAQFSESDKKPATSELLEWFRIISYYNKQATLVGNNRELIDIIKNYEQDSLDQISIPFPQVLLKTWESKQLFEKV